MQILNSLREDRLHGNAAFPLDVYRLACSPGELALDCHWHQEVEFFYVLSGAIRFQIDTEYIEASAGQALFVQGKSLHTGHAIGDSNGVYCAIVFDLSLLNSGGYDLLQSEYIAPLQDRRISLPNVFRGTEDWDKRVLGQLQHIIAAYERQAPGFQLSIKASLFSILSEIASGNHWTSSQHARPADANNIARIKTVLEFIENQYESKIEVKQLAALIHMSEGHFIRFFKSFVHRTPIEHINYCRILHAAALLRHTDHKIMDAAMEVGFDHFSYFIKMFKSQMNCTPSEYRKLHQPIQNKNLLNP